jgi:signal transduction histidine kinase
MSRIAQPFRRLQWQLTLTYVLITLVAALTLEGATVAGALSVNKTLTASPADKLVGDMLWLAPQLAPYLDAPAPNTTALARDATELTQAIATDRAASKQSIEMGQAVQPNSLTRMVKSYGVHVSVAILDSHNRVVAAAASDDITASNGDADAQTQAAVSAALAGGLNGKESQYVGTLVDGRTVAAVALTSLGGRQVGLLVIAAQLQQPPPTLPSQVDRVLSAIQQQDLLPSALYFVLLASIVGTLSGLLVSRSIRRRLRRIAQAARHWSQGELQVVVPHPGHDELGQLAQDLNTMATQLQQLMAAREELAVMEERHRLARDLHDSVKQQLFVVTMLVGTARGEVGDRPEAEQTLREAERLAGEAQQELTALIRALRPVALAKHGLSAALREVCGEWSRRTGITATVDLPDELPLSLTAEQELFRVAQEALANVAEHSGATMVEVQATLDQAALTLRVRDDGHGFDPSQPKPGGGRGLGLGTMRERVESLGGTLLVFGAARGTCVEARIPLAVPALTL